MKVIELIKILQEFPETTKVLIEGYETGYDEITSVEEKVVYPKEKKDRWWNGYYQDSNVDKILGPEEKVKYIDETSISVIALFKSKPF